MKKTVFLASSLLFVTVAIAQSDFEGILTYRNNLVSKTGDITSATWKKIIGQPDEVTTIDGYDCPLLTAGECEDLGIRYRLPRFAGIRGRQDIVPEAAQLYDDR